MAPDYEQAGMPFDPPGVRVSRLEEATTIVKALFAGGPVTVHGDHYRVTGHELYPPPVQDPPARDPPDAPPPPRDPPERQPPRPDVPATPERLAHRPAGAASGALAMRTTVAMG